MIERPRSANRSRTISNELEPNRIHVDNRQWTRSSSNPEGSLSAARSMSRQLSMERSTISRASQESKSTTTTTGFNFLQSIRDLTQQELYRVNPLGLLGKEVISVTGTTHYPEPIPPRDNLAVIDENFTQQIRFPLNNDEINQMPNQPTLSGVLPPGPAEFPTATPLQPCLFSSPSTTTLIADFIPDTMTINVFEVFIYAWGVLAFFFDMVTDLVLAHAYYMEGAYWLFLLTLMCVVVPNLTLSIFSLVWYIDGSQLKAPNTQNLSPVSERKLPTDRQEPNHQSGVESIPLQQRNSIFALASDHDYISQQKNKNLHSPDTTARVLTWIIRIIILVLQLDLCLKYIRGLYYTWKGFQKRHQPQWQRFYLTKQILIDADIALLRVFDCFMDSGSQVTLQLYIMLRLGSSSIKFDNLFFKQCLSIISSLGSLAYALSGYSRCWRHMQLTHSPQGWPKGKPPPQLVSWWSTIIQWIWYLFLITPRVLALAMFAATFRSWFWIIIFAHWWAMLFWILRFRTIFCISDQTKYNPREAIFEKCYNLVCSYIFIFCYMNLRQGDTRKHYIGFYIIYYIENLTFSIIYAIHSSEKNSFLKYSLVIFVCSGFWFAILFQFFYYRFLHPNNHVRLNTKEHFSSLVRIDRLKRSKSAQELADHRRQSDLFECQSFQSDKTSDERWHNRFAKENRQKLLSQQKVIDQKVKLTRAQKHLVNQRPTTSVSVQSAPVSDKFRSPTDQKTNVTSPSVKNGEEMILTAAKLNSHLLPPSSSWC